MQSKQYIILGILIAYMVFNVLAGILMSKKNSSKNSNAGFLSNYFIGGRTMGGMVLAMTLVATYTSASSFLGGPGLAASWGLTQSWIAIIQIGTAFLTLGVLGKKLGLISRRIHAVTISDYLKARYESPAVVIICSLALVVFFITQMVAQFMGGATLLQTVTGLPYWAGLLLFALVVILYTSVGGFTAVVVTDTIQGIVMTFGTFLLMFFVFRAGGGASNLIEQVSTTVPGWTLLGLGFPEDTVALSPGYLISFWVLVGIGVMGLPQTAVRGMGFKDTKSLHSAMIYGTLVVGILMVGMHFIGAVASPLLPEDSITSTDQVIPYIVLNYMPAWAGGLFLAAPLAAIMSTVDSLLLLASATIITDIWITYFAKDKAKKNLNSDVAEAEKFKKKVKKYSFALTIVIGVIVFCFALNPPTILVWVNLFAMGGLESTFFWSLLGGLYWKYGNAKGSIASIIVGIATFVFFNLNKIAPFHVHEIVMALIFSGIAYFTVSALTKEEPSETILKKCF
ncbi:sodium/pantothenate symporter [Bacteroides heparinolyticus]|uniref:sodium/pantothenate symporter n=1 Tax=Prevotella heparinolytica TaxID=28113 RepID=UPI0035A1875F